MDDLFELLMIVLLYSKHFVEHLHNRKASLITVLERLLFNLGVFFRTAELIATFVLSNGMLINSCLGPRMLFYNLAISKPLMFRVWHWDAVFFCST